MIWRPVEARSYKAYVTPVFVRGCPVVLMAPSNQWLEVARDCFTLEVLNVSNRKGVRHRSVLALTQCRLLARAMKLGCCIGISGLYHSRTDRALPRAVMPGHQRLPSGHGCLSARAGDAVHYVQSRQ